MLLQDEMKQTLFSNSERVIIDFILEKQDEIRDYSTSQIAKETFTSPSTLVRISKKLGFDGWIAFKEAFLDEVNYLNYHFKDIDANFPFEKQDSIMNIAAKIVNLHIESAKDTLSLIEHDSLQQAVQLINKSEHIQIFAIGNLNYIAQEFVLRLRRIKKNATIYPLQGVMSHDAAMMTNKDCAICISYSGETPMLLNIVHYLKENEVPIISLTSIGKNRLSSLSDISMHMTTREKSYKKIASYSSMESITILLDVLYSCLFNLNYQENLDYKFSIASKIENNRIIDNKIIDDKEK